MRCKHVFAAFLVAWMLSGCAGRIEPERVPDLVWPAAPEKPRIRLVDSVSTPADLSITESAFTSFMNHLKGTSVETDTLMASPYGVETDSSGKIYVVDAHLKKVHIFDPVGKNYESIPEGEKTFDSPIDIAISEDEDRLYITDSKKKVVKTFRKSDGKPVGEIGRGFFERPTGIAVNHRTSELLVVDTVASAVLRYDLVSGELKNSLVCDDETFGEFHYPTNIFVGRAGRIFVSDSLNFKIKIFSPDGDCLNEFGGVGDGPGYFARPRGVASDSDDNIYVVDALFDNIQIFDRTGALLLAFGSHGSGFGQFWLPSGIFIDENDLIYVADTYNRRIQIFQYMGQ